MVVFQVMLGACLSSGVGNEEETLLVSILFMDPVHGDDSGKDEGLMSGKTYIKIDGS